MIGRRGERGSGVSVLAARPDDDDLGRCHMWMHVYTHLCAFTQLLSHGLTQLTAGGVGNTDCIFAEE